MTNMILNILFEKLWQFRPVSNKLNNSDVWCKYCVFSMEVSAKQQQQQQQHQVNTFQVNLLNT